jgi:hypothetical protein
MASEPDVPVDLPDNFNTRIAGLTDEGQQEVYEGIEEGEIAPEDLLDRAEEADTVREDIAESRREQAEAVEAGDYTEAKEHANDVGYAMRELDDLGANVDDEIIEADRAEAHLDDAEWEQDTANELHEDAADYAESGDLDTASNLEDMAEGHDVDAADAGDAGDSGGTTADLDDVSTMTE